MAGAGFNQDPIQFVNLIADNLRDRYQTGFPVLKELIQNTDDALASEFHYGLSSGLPKAVHPLLRGPGLFLINNGKFKASDARGIRSFGLNSKAADKASIGKFGLGMKSVFHFCEAFFFLAHYGNQTYAEVLNPWSGPDSEQTLHQDWDQFRDEDVQIIRNRLSGIIDKISPDPGGCFILWLPLRKKAHLDLPNGKRTGSIVSEYPGDDMALLDFLDEDDLGVKIATLIPMLRHVKRAAYWKIDRIRPPVEPNFYVVLGDGAKRPSLVKLESDIPGDNRKVLKGRIHVIRNEVNQTLDFSGMEYFGWNPSLTAMHSHDLWPSSYVRDNLGRSREAKDKAQPHGAVYFSRTPGMGRLITNWSVFLPLDEARDSQTIRCDGIHDFRLTLHGYFFVDAGRQGVHGLDDCDGRSSNKFDSEETLRRAWNCELLRIAVLPLLLPALDAFCTDLSLVENARTALSDALNRTSLLNRFRDPITERQSWLREITQDGVRWALRSNVKKVLGLPVPPAADPTRPWRLFAGLQAITNKYWLSVTGAPNIVHPESVVQWNEQDLFDLMESIDSRALFSESTLLDYFASFLKESAGPCIRVGTVNKTLANLFKQGIILNDEDKLGKNQQRVREIISHIDEKRCFQIENQLPSTLLKQLFSIDTDILLVPARFYPPAWTSSASLSVEDAASLLRKVHDALDIERSPSKGLQKAALTLSRRIIEGVPVGFRANLLHRCTDLHVLEAFDCRADETLAVSPGEIRSVRDNGLLFGYSQGLSPLERLGLAPAFQKVLPRDRVVLINKETAELALNQERAIAPCNGGAVLRALGQKARILGDLKGRANLAGSVGAPDGDTEIRGLRLLLHADVDQFFNCGDSLWILGEEQHPVWRKLWAQLVEDEEDPWNLLKSDIADQLSRETSRMVNIKEIRADSVVEELIRRNLSVIDSSRFDQKECEQILREVTDDALWLSLPFHWTRQGNPVRGDAENVYLECDGTNIQDELLLGVDLIPCSQDVEVSRRQKDLLKPLDESAVIEIALRRPDMSNVWRVIVDALQSQSLSSNSPSTKLIIRIKGVTWVPSDGEALYSPDDIIDFETIEGELDRILAQAPGTFITPSRLDAEVKAHPFYPKVRESYFVGEQEGLERLALVLADLDQYQIGGVAFEDSDALRESAQFLSSYGHAGWRLLANLVIKTDGDLDLTPVASSMNRAMSLDAIVNLLNWVADRGSDSKQAAHVFNRYLKVFAKMENAADAVFRLKLLNQANRWVPSKELVSGVVGVAVINVLDLEQARILDNLIFQDQGTGDSAKYPEEIDSTTQLAACAEILREYFQLWVGRVTPALTGALVLLFGADESIKTHCEDCVRPHSRVWLIAQFPWQTPQGTECGGAKTWLSGFSFESALEYFRMTVRVHDAQTLRVHSILGEVIQVGLEEKFSTLFVGKPSYFPLDKRSGYRVDLVLRKIAIEQCSEKQLSSCLRNSTDYLLREVFNQTQPRLDALWNELDKSTR